MPVVGYNNVSLLHDVRYTNKSDLDTYTRHLCEHDFSVQSCVVSQSTMTVYHGILTVVVGSGVE